MPRKRILLLIKGLGRGGAEQLLASAVSYHDRDRFEYEVAYVLPWKDALVAELRKADLPVHCLDGAKGAGWVRRLRRLIDQRAIDLIHSHSPTVAVAARVIAPPRVRHVYTEHGLWEHYHPLTGWANALTFARSDHVFAVSDHVRDSISYPRTLRRLHMPPVERLYHGIDPTAVARWLDVDGMRAELSIERDAPVVGTVANFKSHKRLDRMLDVADLVRRRLPKVRFVMVGTGQLEDEIRRSAHARDLDRTVVFTGFRDDAPRLVSGFDVFAMSSEFEGLSVAVIEALALGIPAVVTAVGGMPEVVNDGEQGYVVPPGDTSMLAERLVTLLQDRPLRRRMGEAGRARAAQFDIRHAVRRMEEVYEELLT
jgi:glycosyltransferase involved in cell wall biosynthesis